ncbi:MAG: hypothetical protein ACRDMJ_14420 [Solirubrobacteraceae bacterium]
MMRQAKPVLVAVAVAALAGAGAASASTYRDGPLTATFRAPTHHPNCRQKWPVTVTATYNGRPARATAFYQFMYGGTVVGRQYPFSNTRRNRHDRLWHFRGRFTDNTFGPFGSLAVGQPITVRAVVRDGRYTAYPSYSVRVVRVRGCRAVR